MKYTAVCIGLILVVSNVRASEFDVVGATYFAVAPSGYAYSTEQNGYYGARKYSSLAAAEAALPASPTTPLVVNILGQWTNPDSLTSLQVSGPAVTATNFLVFRTVGEARHAGKWSDTAYRIESTFSADSAALRLYVPFVTIDGLQVRVSTTSATNEGKAIHGYANLTTGRHVISNCILEGGTTAGGALIGYAEQWSSATPIFFANCLFSGFRAGGAGVAIRGSTLFAYNVTAYDCDLGFKRNGTSGTDFTAKNCLANECDDGFQGPFGASSSNNCSDLASDAPSNNSVTGAVAFVDATNGDFHLAASDTVVRGAGIDLSSDADYPFSTDIDGQPRSGPWDIGADQSGGNTAPTISTIADQTINQNMSTGALAFTIGDAETSASTLELTKGSTNTTLVPTANIVFGGSGANRTVTITPAAGQVGSATITLTVSDGSLSTATSFTVSTNAPTPGITSSTAATGQVGIGFNYQITATSNPTGFNATGLPAGLSVNTSTGAIAGTPTTAGASNVTISASNASGTGSATLTLTINPPAPVITSASSAAGQVGAAFNYQITASNNPTSFDATGLPAGLSVNTSTGAVTGTPTTAGTSSVTIRATNVSGMGSATLVLTIHPSTPVITSASSASGQVGVAFSYQIAATNSPTGFNATGLPAGLSVNTTTGAITGNPATAGASSVTISATNAGGTGSATLLLTIDAIASSPTITLPLATDFEAAQGYTLGTLDGQNGWIAVGTVQIVNDGASSGTQSLRLDGGSPSPQAEADFDPAPGQPVVFVDLFAKPVAHAAPTAASNFDLGAVRLAAVEQGSTGGISVWHGDGAGGGSWQASGFQFPINAQKQATAWLRLSVRVDYTAKRWDFYADGSMRSADLRFLNDATSGLADLTLLGPATGTARFDDIFVGFENPLFVDTDKDGISDDYEIANGMDPNRNDRNEDLDGDGLINVFEHLVGTRANLADTDGDGASDGWEVEHGFDPNSSADRPLPNGVDLIILTPSEGYYGINTTSWEITPVGNP